MYQLISKKDFLTFKNRCYQQIRKMNATGAIWIDESAIFSRYCKLNDINSKRSNSDFLVKLSDEDLYFGLLIAFGTVVKEML